MASLVAKFSNLKLNDGPSSSYLHLAYLRRRLRNLRYNGQSDLSSLFEQFDETIAKIRSSAGEAGKMDDIKVILTLLASFPSVFDEAIADLGEINENNLVTLETVKESLLDFDQKRKKRHAPVVEEAPSAERGAKLCHLSLELAAVVGEDFLPMHEVVKKILAYIKERNLHDPECKQFTICDDDLFRVIGVKRFRSFAMMKYLRNHYLE